jgi:hypothetical protein
MRKHILLVYIASLLLCSLALADVTVFRGVDRKNATFAKINNAQWRIDADGLSTFEEQAFGEKGTGKPCQVYFVIEDVSSKPAQGTRGQIRDMPTGYMAEYTPQHGGEGHWSIQAPAEISVEAFQDCSYKLCDSAKGRGCKCGLHWGEVSQSVKLPTNQISDHP